MIGRSGKNKTIHIGTETDQELWSCELFLLRGVILKVKGQHRDGVMGLPDLDYEGGYTMCVHQKPSCVCFVLCKDLQ